jgi:xanthine dehydrogenase accessory factor
VSPAAVARHGVVAPFCWSTIILAGFSLKDAIALFGFLIEAANRGERSALVTITDVEGGSSREPGTHLAVTESGQWYGSLSGGCVEAAVVAEAQRVIRAGQAEQIRFGAGSRYIDIRLPCGGAIDLLISPMPAPEVIIAAHDRLGARRSVALALSPDGAVRLIPEDCGSEPGWRTGLFIAIHHPDLRLLIAGHGAECAALARLGVSYGACVELFSPDDAIIAVGRSLGIASVALKAPSQVDDLRADEHSAVVLLYHDHDWETGLLIHALAQDPFYIGAMGSARTHGLRLEALQSRGIGRADLDRVRGPIGLIASARDPETLALSVLGEIVSGHRSVQQRRAKALVP